VFAARHGDRRTFRFAYRFKDGMLASIWASGRGATASSAIRRV
jgi:hypothetical protein